MTYTPNFNDKRVKARARIALGFVIGVLSDTKPHQWSTRFIDKFFGSQNHQLSKWLRKNLLIVTDDKYFFGSDYKCKEYILNRSGVAYLKEQLGITDSQSVIDEAVASTDVQWTKYVFSLKDEISPLGDSKIIANNNTHILPYCSTSLDSDYELVKEAFDDKYGNEIKARNFEYNDQSNRYWHPLQNMRSNFRTRYLSEYGFKYQYDIQCCAPTLILNHSRRCGNDLWLPALDQYLKDRKLIRQQIASEADIPVDVAKRIINALFAGAHISHSPTTQIYQMLCGDHARIEFLQQFQYLIDLKKDIKICWDYINETLPQRYITTKNGKKKRVPLSAKRKWGVYFELERQVIDVVRDYLNETNNQCFLEHDGWTCVNELDITSVEQHIEKVTGMSIKLEQQDHC